VARIDASNNYWAVIPLTAGANTITATLTAADGSVINQSINVNATGVASLYSVVANKSAGLVPFAVTFTFSNLGSLNATVTFDGVTYNLGAGVVGSLPARTYTAPGVYTYEVVFRDATGSRSQWIVIDAKDPAQMDQMFQAIWNGMNNALVAGDKAGAMVYLNTSAQTKFGPVFDVLMPYMSEIVSSYSVLARATLSPQIGEYAVVRTSEGKKRLYLIYFLLDADGVWRIDEM